MGNKGQQRGSKVPKERIRVGKGETRDNTAQNGSKRVDDSRQGAGNKGAIRVQNERIRVGKGATRDNKRQ